MLYYHGGPHNSVALGFNEKLHVLAGAGFAVVGVNFRGSTGFGAAYADSILGDWGPRELADGLAIVDALVEQGVVDPRRLGVYGGSYGGFMTNLALARTDRFAAGVSFATISGMDTWGYQTDHWESVDWDSGGQPGRFLEYYRSHSPLTYVADIRAPLLILHGEADYRCSVAEADQLFGALRKLKRHRRAGALPRRLAFRSPTPARPAIDWTPAARGRLVPALPAYLTTGIRRSARYNDLCFGRGGYWRLVMAMPRSGWRRAAWARRRSVAARASSLRAITRTGCCQPGRVAGRRRGRWSGCRTVRPSR